MMSFEVNGKSYEFDQNKLALAESIMVHEESGLTIQSFNLGLMDLHPRALKSMVWLAKRRAGEAVRYIDVEFDVVAFCNSIKNDNVPGEAADPTASQPIDVPTPDGSSNGMIHPEGAPNTSEPLPTTWALPQ